MRIREHFAELAFIDFVGWINVKKSILEVRPDVFVHAYPSRRVIEKQGQMFAVSKLQWFSKLVTSKAKSQGIVCAELPRLFDLALCLGKVHLPSAKVGGLCSTHLKIAFMAQSGCGTLTPDMPNSLLFQMPQSAVIITIVTRTNTEKSPPFAL